MPSKRNDGTQTTIFSAMDTADRTAWRQVERADRVAVARVEKVERIAAFHRAKEAAAAAAAEADLVDNKHARLDRIAKAVRARVSAMGCFLTYHYGQGNVSSAELDAYANWASVSDYRDAVASVMAKDASEKGCRFPELLRSADASDREDAAVALVPRLEGQVVPDGITARVKELWEAHPPVTLLTKINTAFPGAITALTGAKPTKAFTNLGSTTTTLATQGVTPVRVDKDTAEVFGAKPLPGGARLTYICDCGHGPVVDTTSLSYIPSNGYPQGHNCLAIATRVKDGIPLHDAIRANRRNPDTYVPTPTTVYRATRVSPTGIHSQQIGIQAERFSDELAPFFDDLAEVATYANPDAATVAATAYQGLQRAWSFEQIGATNTHNATKAVGAAMTEAGNVPGYTNTIAVHAKPTPDFAELIAWGKAHNATLNALAGLTATS